MRIARCLPGKFKIHPMSDRSEALRINIHNDINVSKSRKKRKAKVPRKNFIKTAKLKEAGRYAQIIDDCSWLGFFSTGAIVFVLSSIPGISLNILIALCLSGLCGTIVKVVTPSVFIYLTPKNKKPDVINHLKVSFNIYTLGLILEAFRIYRQALLCKAPGGPLVIRMRVILEDAIQKGKFDEEEFRKWAPQSNTLPHEPFSIRIQRALKYVLGKKSA